MLCSAWHSCPSLHRRLPPLGKILSKPRPVVSRLKASPRGFVVQASVVEGEAAPSSPSPVVYPWREGPVVIDGQVAHSMTEQRFEIVQSLEPFLRKEVHDPTRDRRAIHLLSFQVLKYLKPVEKIWQPADYLPVPQSENFMDEVDSQWMTDQREGNCCAGAGVAGEGSGTAVGLFGGIGGGHDH